MKKTHPLFYKIGAALLAAAVLCGGPLPYRAAAEQNQYCLCGDVDGDGKVTAADARKILRFAVQLETPDASLLRLADLDGSGAAEAADARTALRIAVALEERPAHRPGDPVRENAVPATCTEEGSYEESIYCTVCGAELSRETKPAGKLAHTETAIPAVQPTCTEPGRTEGVKCAVCGETLKTSEVIPALGHTPETHIAAAAPSCTEAGCTEGVKCAVCGETLKASVEIPALGHTPETYIEAAAPSCTEPGRTEGVKCAVCGDVLQAAVSLAALGHNFADYNYNNDACCTANGTKTAVCTRCGARDTVPAPGTAAGHRGEPTGWRWAQDGRSADLELRCTVCGETYSLAAEVTVSSTDADCDTPGTTVYSARLTYNGKEYTDVRTVSGSPLGHSYGSWQITVPAGCETEGERRHACVRCGHTETEPTPALGHSFGEWTESIAPGCETPGERQRICARCSAAQTDAIPAAGHNYTYYPAREPTCTAPGWNAYRLCARCGDTDRAELPPKGHAPGAPVSENEIPPTCTLPGSREEAVFCTVCGEELSRETKEIPPAGHSLAPAAPQAYIGAGPVDDAVFRCGVCGLLFADEAASSPAAGYYDTLFEALSAAKAGEQVVLLTDAALTQDAAVPAGVTLLLPYAKDLLSVNGPDADLPYANTAPNGNVSAVTPAGEQVSVALTLNGCTLTVEKDALLCLGGTFSGNHPVGGGTYGSHAELHMKNNAGLLVQGILSSFGYITGEGEVALAGGALYEPFIITDYHGGTYSAVAFGKAEISPFNSYTVMNVQTPLTVNSDSSVYGYCSLYASGKQNSSSGLLISGSGGLFMLSEGASMRFVYRPEFAVEGDCGAGRTEITANGDITMNSMRLNAAGLSLNTRFVDLPVPYHFSYTQASGKLTAVQGVRLLPGSEVYVAEGAALEVRTSLYVFDCFAAQAYSGRSYPSGALLAAAGLSERAHLIVDGVLTVYRGYVSFAGLTETHGTGKIVTAAKNTFSAAPADGVMKGDSFMGYAVNKTNKTEYPLRAWLTDADGNTIEMEPGKTYVAVSGAAAQLTGGSCVIYKGDAAEPTAETVELAYTAPQTVYGAWREAE